MSDHTPEHKEQTQQGGMGGQKQGDMEKPGAPKQGDMGTQQPGTQTERREEAPRTNG